MTDQAAAEALVAVGRGSQGHGQDRSVGEETTDDESESRSRKKPRRSAPEISGVDMDVDEGKSDRQRRRDNADPQASHGWMDQQQQQGSPSNFAGNFSAVDPQGGRGGSYEGFGNQRSYGSGGGRVDLPPLNDALRSGDKNGSRFGMRGPSRGPGDLQYGNPPSRTQSPLAHQQVSASTAQGFQLPPPHTLAQGHPPSVFPGGSGQSARQTSPRASSPSHVRGGTPSVPTLSEMQSHLQLLEQQRASMEALLARTDRMISGVKRGIDEMRVAQNPSAPSVPLPLRTTERTREGGNVWPVDSPNRD